MSAIAAAAVAAATAVVGILNERSSSNKELQDYGKHLAAVEADRQRAQQGLVGQGAAVMEMRQQRDLTIQKNAMTSSSDAAVAAAAAGSSGQSVEMTQTQIESHAAQAQFSADKQLQNQLRNIDQASRDINFEADKEIFDYEPRSGRGDLSKVFLEGLQGYVFGGGFGS